MDSPSSHLGIPSVHIAFKVCWGQVATIQPEASHRASLVLSTQVSCLSVSSQTLGSFASGRNPCPVSSGQATHHTQHSHGIFLQKVLLGSDFLRREL